MRQDAAIISKDMMYRSTQRAAARVKGWVDLVEKVTNDTKSGSVVAAGQNGMLKKRSQKTVLPVAR